jgi:hypothetical protein
MLRGIIERLRLRSAARRYARALPAQLRRDYGGGPYTRAQIRGSAQRAKLPLAYVCIGYAAFLNEDAFREAADARFRDDYHALRAIFARYAPHGLRSASGGPMDSMQHSGGEPPGDSE